MSDPAEETKLEEKIPLNDSTRVDIDPDESSAHLIKNGGTGGAGDIPDDEYKTTVVGDKTPLSSDGEVSFNGLGKDEVLRYANDPFWVRLRWILFILFWVGWIAMLVTAITIIVLAPRCPPRPDLKWYHTETIYKVLPQSFKDSDNDGYGDYQGLLDKLNYVTDKLNVKTIWLSSIFANDGSEGEYGIINHMELDKKFGVSVSEFTDWIKKIRKQGKKVILDLVPNHTSKKHEWFKKFLLGDEQYKNYYIKSNRTSPSYAWNDSLGTRAWTTENNTEYFHQFSNKLPDLNLKSPEVVAEIKAIMKFWFDAGVSGFYIQDLEYLVEDFETSTGKRNSQGTLTFLEALREVANEYSDKPGRERALFGLVEQATRNQTLEYWGSGEKNRLHVVFPSLKKLDKQCNAECINTMLKEILTDDHQSQWMGLQLTTENIDRIATRMDSGDGNYKKRLMIAHALQLLLPGTAVNYYGDELGQRNGERNDSLNLHGKEKIMTPMQWNTKINANFTWGTPWLKVSDTYKEDNVEGGFAHFAGLTPLEAFIKLVELRKNESMQWGELNVFATQSNLLMFTRKATRFPHFLVLINTGSTTLHASPDEIKQAGVKSVGTLRYHSRDIEVNQQLDVASVAQQLSPFDIVVFEFPTD